ncbi:MAG TPA: Crp/Fnr family transcriptional regulator [Candidatus Saccharimonas sp.]|nr:Crp/Fnr family transcriptional regulator [Candidatus Saccharimonas sp.]
MHSTQPFGSRLVTNLSLYSWYSGSMDQTVAQKIERFFESYPSRHYHKGQILIHAHDEPAHVFHLLEGKVKEYDISYRGDEVVLNVFKPPAFFPISYAINKTPNVYFYEAETDIELKLAPIDEVVGFLKSNADVTYDLLGRVFKGTDGLLGRLAHLMAGTARSRVLYELLIEARRFGELRAKGVAISLTESDIGTHAGLARETVSREIRKLKSEGLISVIKNEIWINDIEQLAASVSREL